MDYVILPGLIDGLIPRKRWNRTNNDWILTKDSDYEQARSSFYVGLTRAKRAAILIEGTLWHSYKGILNQSTPSTFVSSIRNTPRQPCFPVQAMAGDNGQRYRPLREAGAAKAEPSTRVRADDLGH
ncbi:hypothetical protein ACTMTJ_41725 [Phytohabitans sp. LJ34]|uniref:hypothetical protein n=1 Tax=Phytohabitans sp. LJ34 TaxID=3452217 RepID=UPI003F8C2C30